jgi:hypothetical protein
MDDQSKTQSESTTLSPHLEVSGVLGVRNNKSQNVDDGLIAYVDALEEIDENSPLAKLNEVSISDGNGGRILL